MWLRKDEAEVATLQRVENIIPVNSFIFWCYTMGVRALLQGMRGQPLRTRFLAVAWIVGITRHFDFKPEQVTLPWFSDFNWPYTVRSLVWIALIHLDIINPQVTQPNEISNLLPQFMIFTARKEGRDKRRLESFRRFLTFHGRDLYGSTHRETLFFMSSHFHLPISSKTCWSVSRLGGIAVEQFYGLASWHAIDALCYWLSMLLSQVYIQRYHIQIWSKCLFVSVCVRKINLKGGQVVFPIFQLSTTLSC